MVPIEETESLAHFATDPAPFVQKLRDTGEPLLLTVDGEPGLVIQDAESYRRFLDELGRLQVIGAVKESLQAAAAGQTRPIREVLAELAERHQLQP